MTKGPPAPPPVHTLTPHSRCSSTTASTSDAVLAMLMTYAPRESEGSSASTLQGGGEGGRGRREKDTELELRVLSREQADRQG